MEQHQLQQVVSNLVTRQEFSEFVARTDQRFERIETKLEKLNLLDHLINSVDGLVKSMHNMQQEHIVMHHSLERIEIKLDNHERRIQRLERVNGILRIEPAA